MPNKLDIKEQICQHCGTSLELFVEATEIFSAVLLDQKIEEEIPTFDVELGDSEIKYEAFLKCSKCNIKAYDASRDMAFDDTNDILIFPQYDPDSKTGFKVSLYSSYSQAVTPKEEPPLPTIKRASAGEEIVSKTTEDDYLMAMGGYD